MTAGPTVREACKVELDQLPPAAADMFDADDAARAVARLAVVRKEYEALSTSPVPDLDSLSRRIQALEVCADLPSEPDAVASEQMVATERETARVERGTRKHQIETLKYERIINDGFLRRIDGLLTSLQSHKAEAEKRSLDELMFQSIMASLFLPR